MIRPTFFIIGAARAGTTTLFDMLSRHPDVFCCPVKEPQFFSADIGRGADEIERARRDGRLVRGAHGTGAPAPRVGLTLTEADYLGLFVRAGGRPARGEASTDYLPSRVAPAAVHGFAPDARIIVLLRNPVERAWSHHLMAGQNGRPVPDFGAVIAAEWLQLRADPGMPLTGCIGRGLYARQLEPWLSLFGEQVLVLPLEALARDAAGTLATVLRHIGADPARQPPAPAVRRNRSRALRLGWVNRALTASGLRDPLLRWTPAPLRRTAGRLVFRDRPAPALPEAQRAALTPLFADDIRRTEALVGLDLSHWLDQAPVTASLSA